MPVMATRCQRAYRREEARDGELHEVLTGAPLAVASGAPAGDLAHLQELTHDLIERPAVADAKLLASEVLLLALLAVAADLDT